MAGSNSTPENQHDMDLSANYCRRDSNNFDLEIDEPFEDTTALVGEEVSLICKVNGNLNDFKWYRNGRRISFDDRVQGLADEKYQKFTLKIKETARHDIGIYKFEVNNDMVSHICRGKLFVGIAARNVSSICTGPIPRYALEVIEQLKHVTVAAGESFELSATFNSESTGPFRWFKNERALLADRRCIISCTENNSTVNVLGSKMTDTGIYIVAAKTNYGITSSWTDVQVFNDDMNMPNNESASVFEEIPLDTKAREGEEIRIIFKVRPSYRSEVKWSRIDKCLEVGGRVQLTDYGDGYRSMRIKNVKLSDAGQYALHIKDKVTGEQKTEVFNISVFCASKSDIQLLQPLQSSIMTYGAPVTLHCKFDVRSCKEYFFCYYVGHYRVTLSDSRFKVACKNGVSLLEIKKMEPGMTGEARCEIRTPLPNGKSIVRASTTCNLAIVPTSVLLQELSLRVKKVPCAILSQKYSKWSMEGLVSAGDTAVFKSGFHMRQPPLPVNCTLFYIEYCRLEGDNYYYMDVSQIAEADKYVIVTVEKSQTQDSAGHWRYVKIEWDYQGRNTPNDQEVWYNVDYQMRGGYFVHIGVTSVPYLMLNTPAINESALFRISTIVPDPLMKDVRLSIRQQPKCLVGLPDSFIPHPMYQYVRRYQNHPGTLGTGAYGSVCVAKKLATGTDYAVKTIVFKSFEHKETCNREIHILKTLKHPSIIMLYDAYRDDKHAKLVMECLWGGELFERIVTSTHVDENEVMTYSRQICDALAFLHKKNIAHLDIKPENLICVHPNSRRIKLVDFGLSRRLNPGYRVMVLNGTRSYVPPEVLKYDQLTVQCDMWSFGVVTYMMFSGFPPFIAESWYHETLRIVDADYNYEDRAFSDVSDVAKNFIDNLLVVDADKRMTAEQALMHPWLRECPAERPPNILRTISTTRSRWQVNPESN